MPNPFLKRFLGIMQAGSITLALTTLASYALGLLRDRAFATTFGASHALDAYNAAFLLPDLLFNILIASGIAAAFVPTFTELYYKDKQRAQEYSNSVISGAVIMMTLAAVILAIFAKQISFLVAPGFDMESRLLVAKIIRILAFSPILFGISNALGAMLIAERRFLFYGLSPVFYNLGIIGGAVLLAPKFGIMGVALGTLAGAVLHLLLRAIDAIRLGFKFKLRFAYRTPEFKETLRLMLPKMFGHPVELAMFWGFTIIASSLATGSVAVMNFARNFQSVPVSLIGITFSTTAFPVLAKAIADNSPGEFKRVLKNSFWLILAGSSLAAVVIFFIREPLIRLILGGGAFDDAAIRRTAMALGVFTLTMPTESLIHLLARAFYATKNTVIPVVMSFLGLVIAVVCAYLLAPSLDILAIPLSFFIASFIEIVILVILIPRRLKSLQSNRIDPQFDPHQP